MNILLQFSPQQVKKYPLPCLPFQNFSDSGYKYPINDETIYLQIGAGIGGMAAVELTFEPNILLIHEAKHRLNSSISKPDNIKSKNETISKHEYDSPFGHISTRFL